MTAEEELIYLRQKTQEQAAYIQVLQEQVKQLPVLQALVSQLTEQVNSLQERVAKDSHNSSLPPSSDRFVRQPRSLRKKSGKKAGGQQGHTGRTLQMSETPDEVIVHGVERCECCQHDLTQVAAVRVERRQVVEVPTPQVRVREHRTEAKCCPHCQHYTTAPFPAEVRAPVQYGASIAACAVYLSHQQLLPYARVCEVLADLLGVALSEGSLREMIGRCATQLESVEPQIKTALRQAGVIHQDETGVYVANSRHWLHVTATARLTHYQVHRSRGHEALEAIGILPDYRGISIHDSFGSYFLYDECQHALCNVHLLRELTYLAEDLGLWWAAKLKALLLDMKEATEQARTQGRHWLHPLEVVDWQHQYLEILAQGDLAHPRAQAPPGHRGRVKQHRARNLLDRLRKHQLAVWAFLQDLRVDFDNNQAERDLRMVKVQQKVSGCFRSVAGAVAFARIRGYLSTVRKQEMPVLAALEATLLGHPVLPSFETT